MNIKKIFQPMTRKKLIIICSAAAAVLALIVGLLIWIFRDKYDDSLGTAFVTPVSDINTAAVNMSGNVYSGVVESQKAFEVKADSDKAIKEIKVREGDEVKEGDLLFIYDVESMNLDLEAGKIEIESMKNSIESNESQIKELESEKKSAGSDAQISYNNQIQALKTENDKTEYNIKVKQVSLDKLESAIKNSSVTAEISGTVKNLKSDGQTSETDMDMYGGETSADVIMTIVTNSSYRIKGKINEQNIGMITEGQPMIINSRVDDDISWNGVVSEISNEPEANNNDMMYYMDGDSDSSSSNYSFYIEPDNIEGLRLGQHVLISPDFGRSVIEKEGIWLYDDYLVADGERFFVWAANDDNRLEKRYVEIGQKDEDNFDSEILSGLKEDDMIAYPADDYQEGMKASDNIEDVEVKSYDDADMLPEDGDIIDDEFNYDEFPEGDIEGIPEDLMDATGDMIIDENGGAIDDAAPEDDADADAETKAVVE
ncbi:MAG: efflux RND transporter periplasmic adaptor subunit [Clostridium sp.]|nr:efflux RND transporter periplasmic adaptor subunit [Clostridium sp.]